jgi:spore maturation protein SpmA
MISQYFICPASASQNFKTWQDRHESVQLITTTAIAIAVAAGSTDPTVVVAGR